MKRFQTSILAGSILLVCGLIELSAGGTKTSPWKVHLSPEVYSELVQRSAKAAGESLSGEINEDTIKKAQFHATLIAGYTLSAKGDPVKLAATRQAAMDLAKMVTYKDQLGQAKKLAGDLAQNKIPPSSKPEAAEWKSPLDEVIDIMNQYRTKARGGEGIHPDLQVSLKLKGVQNGIEEKIRGLATKKLTGAVLDKTAKELVYLASREAVVAGLIYGYAPAKKVGNRDPVEWKELTLVMREAAISLAEAAAKKDADAVFSAAGRLNSSCNQCHTAFRGQ